MRKNKAAAPGREGHHMTKTEAEQYIRQLTYDEKARLNEMLKALAQKRLPSPAPPGSTDTTAQ